MTTPEAQLITDIGAILLVDDEVSVLEALQKTVAAAGWPVVAVEHPEEALRHIETTEFAMVIADYWMPGIDGVQLLKAVRERWPNTERILLTAYADTEALERGINEAAITRFLRKPWKHAVLQTVLEQTMTQSRLRRERELLASRLNNRNEELSYVNRLLESRIEESDRTLMHFRRRWDVALNAISDAVVIVNAELNIEGGNDAAAKLASLPSAELEGRRCHQALFGRSHVCDGCPLRSGAGRVHCSDTGGERTFDVRAYLLPGTPASHLCIYRDITHQLRFEQQAAQVEKMAAIGRLAGGMAHELNNPLHGILSFVQIAAKPETSDEKRARAHEVIRECALRCRDIVQSLRDFSRSPQPNEFTAVVLADVCRKAITLLTTIGSVRIEPHGTWANAKARGNANQLQQVVLNLLQNAIDVTPEGQRIDVEVAVDNTEVFVAVEDRGPGVPLDDRARIFEPFYTTKPVGKGTGLGLAISHSIVQEHDGQLRVLDARLGGARFEMRLPRLQEDRDDE